MLTITLKVTFNYHKSIGKSMAQILIDNESYSRDTNGWSLSFYWCSIILWVNGELHRVIAEVRSKLCTFVAMKRSESWTERSILQYISRRKIAQSYGISPNVRKTVLGCCIIKNPIKIKEGIFIAHSKFGWGTKKCYY